MFCNYINTSHYDTTAIEHMIFSFQDKHLATWPPCPAVYREIWIFLAWTPITMDDFWTQILSFLTGKSFSTDDEELITKPTSGFDK